MLRGQLQCGAEWSGDVQRYLPTGSKYSRILLHDDAARLSVVHGTHGTVLHCDSSLCFGCTCSTRGNIIFLYISQTFLQKTEITNSSSTFEMPEILSRLSSVPCGSCKPLKAIVVDRPQSFERNADSIGERLRQIMSPVAIFGNSLSKKDHLGVVYNYVDSYKPLLSILDKGINDDTACGNPSFDNAFKLSNPLNLTKVCAL